ncbi:MAG: hypothetical protein ACRD00_00435 [Thermoanaerobaculia bacterium]
MAMALLLATALALVGFLFTSVQGFAITAGPHVTRHVGYAIPTVLFSLFSQSMVIFYFIGTGKLVQQELTGLTDAERAAVSSALRRFKMQTSPPATFALLSAIAVFVLGGATHTRALPAWVHLASAIAASGTHLWAFAAESRAFAENNRLMDNPKAYASSISSPRLT